MRNLWNIIWNNKLESFFITICLSNIGIMLYGMHNLGQGSSSDKAAVFASYAALCTAICSVLTLCYKLIVQDNTVNTYEMLNSFCIRYSSDKNIEKVISWLLYNKEDDSNSTSQKSDCNVPTTYEKEMFMHFYEELYIQIEKRQIDKDAAIHLFSYYARLFDERADIRQDIEHYNGEDWRNFKKFVALS